MELRAFHIPAALVIVGIAASVSGAACLQPEDSFKDFEKRYDDIDEASDPSSSSSVSTGVIEGCIPPMAGSAAEGSYIFALSAQLSNTKPIFLRADVTFSADEAAPSISMSLTALRTPYREAADNENIPRFAPIEPALKVGPFPLDAEGQFTAEFPELTVSGKANPFSPNDLVAVIRLESGQTCELNEGEEPLTICGNVSGDVSKPIPIELKAEKNFYAMLKYDGTNVPAGIPYDCGGTLSAAF